MNGCGPDTCKREARVPVAVAEVEKRVEVLHGEIVALRQRLSSVLAPEPPRSPEKADCKVGPNGVPLAAAIEAVGRKVDESLGVVNDIEQRLEV